jgi:hypothetical protein
VICVTEPQSRVGIFLVPSQFTDELLRANERVRSLEVSADGSYAPREWYVARHELFERLLSVAVAHRILPADVQMELADFTASIEKRNRLLWDLASPVERRNLAAKHLVGLANPQLRASLAEVLAHEVDPDAGLWIESEAALAPESDLSEPSEEVSPEELTRRLVEYVAKADQAEAERERLQGPSRYAWLCEITDEVARGPATRMRAAALSSLKDEEGELTEALESFCHRAPVEALRDCVYSAEQARELLAWLKKERRSATRDLMLRVLRPAVANKHAFAIVFVPAMK